MHYRDVGRSFVRCTCGLAALIVAGIGALPEPAQAQTAPIPRREVAVDHVNSGLLDNVAEDGGNDPVLLYQTVIRVDNVPWIRLRFSDVQLSGSARDGNESYVVITSAFDGAVQYLDAKGMADWRKTSAYFNGDAVLLQLFAVPNTGANQIAVSGASVGEWMAGDGPLPETQCGTTDDRVATTDVRIGRSMPIGCTAWLINTGNPHCMLTAGHCCVDPDHDVVQFNVPLSLANGTTVNPPPEDQYPIDFGSDQFSNGGAGNDWCYFGALNNSNTGVSPGVGQGTTGFNVISAPAPNNATIRITGYGVDTGTANQTLQTETGIYDTLSGNQIQYNDIDTEGGNSGSPIFFNGTSNAIGIHTHGGCTSTGGFNTGTANQIAGLQTALANPLGVCRNNSVCPGPESCYSTHGSVGCNNDNCCMAVCGIDPFCCNNNWDNICVGEANQLCAVQANDNCGSANVLTGVAGTRTGDVTGASNDGATTCGSSSSNPDVWYTYTACTSGTLSVNTCGTHDANGVDTGMDTVVSAHSACPGTSVNTITCNDDWSSGSPPNACAGSDAGNARDSAITVSMTAGQTVWVRVSHFSTDVANGVFQLSYSFAGNPANNLCANASTLNNEVTAFCNIGATTDGPSHAATCNFFGEPQIGGDIWYNYVANYSGDLRISLCGSGYDTELAVYQGCNCPVSQANLIACNDDFCGFQSQVTISVSAGQCYKIRVGGFGGATDFDQGSGTITLTKLYCPADIVPGSGNGVVNIDDLLTVINGWGACPPVCPADVHPPGGNGMVNIDDLLRVINSWGPCPSACASPWTCSGTIQTCRSNGAADCFCWTGFNNNAVCAQDFSCASPLCPDGTCPPGFVCVKNSCCGPQAICAPLCDFTEAAPPDGVGPRGSGVAQPAHDSEARR
jgi:V8-like Glu-specific endopeptidase